MRLQVMLPSTIKRRISLKSVFLLCVLVFLVGCQSCKEVTITERVPVTRLETVIVEEDYTQIINQTQEVCDYLFDARITYEPSTWDGDTLRRIAYVENLENERGLFYLTKVYTLNGTEISRDRPAAGFVLDARQKRPFYIVWNTNVDLGKEVHLEIVEHPTRDYALCRDAVLGVEVNGTRNVTKEQEVTRTVTKIRKVCT